MPKTIYGRFTSLLKGPRPLANRDIASLANSFPFPIDIPIKRTILFSDISGWFFSSSSSSSSSSSIYRRDLCVYVYVWVREWRNEAMLNIVIGSASFCTFCSQLELFMPGAYRVGPVGPRSAWSFTSSRAAESPHFPWAFTYPRAM